VRAASAQKRRCDQRLEHVLADGDIGVPETRRLRQRQLQAGHLAIFALHAIRKVGIDIPRAHDSLGHRHGSAFTHAPHWRRGACPFR
jgi:hypothetical protein